MRFWRLICSCFRRLGMLVQEMGWTILIPIIVIATMIILVICTSILETYGSFENWRSQREEKRAMIIESKLQGKKRCWRLRVRYRSLKRREKRLDKRWRLVEQKLQNTTNLLDKYSWEYR